MSELSRPRRVHWQLSLLSYFIAESARDSASLNQLPVEYIGSRTGPYHYFLPVWVLLGPREAQT